MTMIINEEVQVVEEIKHKLNTNENPLGPSRKVINMLPQFFDALHQYPDPNQIVLRNRIAKHHGVNIENILCGNGSDELIQLLINYLFHGNEDGHALFFDSEYFVYKYLFDSAGIVYRNIMADEPKYIINQLVENINQQTKVVIVSNPCNPWGHYYGHDDIVNLLIKAKQCNSYVILDEAYCHFVEAVDYPSSIEILNKYDNVIILRTFSKAYGLAGLRVGYLLASEEVVSGLFKYKLPFNVNFLAKNLACVALEDEEHLANTVKLVKKQKQRFYRIFDDLMVDYYPSQTNFILLKLGCNIDLLERYMQKAGVIINPLKEYNMRSHCRVSIGSEKTNNVFFMSLKSFLTEYA